ncbi:MAG: hypothetical protein A2Z96_02120 [Spirochaetes bacterium GWB1_48_6]|nr:MAG: hypothetical protein A2Z96_02120 [Spirochaetes bacterium GWB1_48_6]
MEYTAGLDDAPKRLDRLSLQLLPSIPRGGILKALRTGRIKLNGKKSSGEDRVQAGDILSFDTRLWHEGRQLTPKNTQNTTPETPLNPRWILFQNQDILVLNKPRGWDSQGENSLDTLVKEYLGTKSSLSFRPGPLHRLDTNTSGILCFSASLSGAQNFSRMLQEGAMTKYYLALVKGSLTEPRILESLLERNHKTRVTTSSPQGKASRTTLLPLIRAPGYTLVLCKLDTGRTHQIRAQAAEAGFPLAGDGRYGGGTFPGGFVLHAWTLFFAPGGSYSWPQTLQAPLPQKSLNQLTTALKMDEKKLLEFLEPTLALRLLPP